MSMIMMMDDDHDMDVEILIYAFFKVHWDNIEVVSDCVWQRGFWNATFGI